MSDTLHACSVCGAVFTRRDGAVLRVGRRVVYLCGTHAEVARAAAQASAKALAAGAQGLLKQRAPVLYGAIEAALHARQALQHATPTPDVIDAEVIHER